VFDYKKKATMKNKNGKPLPKQAHMELAMVAGLDVTLGDTLFYINTGTAKSHGDLKSVKNKETGTSKVTLNCKLISPEVVEKDFEKIKELEMLKKALTKIDDKTSKEYGDIEIRIDEIASELFTDEYNVARYLDAFNKKVKPLLVCFHPDIRTKILLDIEKVKDKKAKTTTERLKQRTIFTKSECELVSGMPNKVGDQDSYEDLMRMEDKEIKFWNKVNKIPNNMEVEFWETIRADYHERMRIAKIEGIQREKDALEDIFKHLEVADLNAVITKGVLPPDVFVLTDITVDGTNMLISRKWNEPLCHIDGIFKYEDKAIERDTYYKLFNCETADNRYQQWVDYVTERNVMTGDTSNITIAEVEHKDVEIVAELLKETAKTIIIEKQEPKKKLKMSEGVDDEDDNDVEEEEDDAGDLVRTDEKIQLDDEYDDTKGEMPDDYDSEKFISIEPEVKKEDEWPF